MTKLEPLPTWQPISARETYGDDLRSRSGHSIKIEVLRSGDDGPVVAVLEDFGYAAYPRALNAETGNWERGGAYAGIGKYDPVTKIKISEGDPDAARVNAKLWAERVAGLHPLKEGDQRPPFYYSNLPEEGKFNASKDNPDDTQ